MIYKIIISVYILVFIIKVHKYKKILKICNNIKYFYENEISECLSKTKSVGTIIPEIISIRKPYILFISDVNDMMY